MHAVVTLAKTVGAKVMLDGAQRAPHGPLDLPAMGIDFYVFAGHKAYGPNGIGVLWAKAEHLEAMPPFHGGGSMIGRVTFAETTWAPPPRRFEAGTPPIGPAIGLGAACKWMRGLDWTEAHAHEMALVERLMDGLQKIDGAQLFGPASTAEPLSRACRSCSTACIRTTWRRPWIRSASPCAPAIIAASR